MLNTLFVNTTDLLWEQSLLAMGPVQALQNPMPVDKPPQPRYLPALFFNHLAQLFPVWKRSPTGKEDVGQQLIARQTRQVQALGKGLDPVGMAAE